MKRTIALGCAAAVCVCGAMTATANDPKPAASATAAVASTEPLVHEAMLRAPIAEAWTIFTTEAGLKRLGAAKADVDFRIGGLLRSTYDPKAVLGDETTIHNQIMAYEPMRMVAWRISKPPKGFPFMNAYKEVWSVATFTDLGDGRTHLRLAMCGYQADEESQKMRAFFKSGNQWVMDTLVASFDPAAKGPKGPAH